MTEEEKIKNKIDSMSYYAMLRLWRFAPSTEPLVSKDAGKYFEKRMKTLKEGMTNEEHVSISKQVGWE